MSGRRLVRIGGYDGPATLEFDGESIAVFATIDCYRAEDGGSITWSGRVQGDEELAVLIGLATLTIDGRRGEIMLRSLGSFVGNGPPPIALPD